MRLQDITLFISEDRAATFARRSIKSTETFTITPGTVRWGDGSIDRGFRVSIFNDRRQFERHL